MLKSRFEHLVAIDRSGWSKEELFNENKYIFEQLGKTIDQRDRAMKNTRILLDERDEVDKAFTTIEEHVLSPTSLAEIRRLNS